MPLHLFAFGEVCVALSYNIRIGFANSLSVLIFIFKEV